MGACTATIDADGYSPQDASNAGYTVRCKITLSNSYATGGDTIAASILGIGNITKLSINAATKTSDTTKAYDLLPVYDSSGVNVTKVQAFWSATSGNPFAEVTAATDLSLVVADAIASGV